MKKFGILIVLVLMLLGLTALLNKQKTPVQNPDTKGVIETAKNFYDFYDSCMKNPPKQAKDRVGEYCQQNSGLTTSDFAVNLEKGGTAKAGADPIICAQNPFQSFTIGSNVQIQDNKATVPVIELFGSTQLVSQVVLINSNGWKIDNIICPKPG